VDVSSGKQVVCCSCCLHKVENHVATEGLFSQKAVITGQTTSSASTSSGGHSKQRVMSQERVSQSGTEGASAAHFPSVSNSSKMRMDAQFQQYGQEGRTQFQQYGQEGRTQFQQYGQLERVESEGRVQFTEKNKQSPSSGQKLKSDHNDNVSNIHRGGKEQVFEKQNTLQGHISQQLSWIGSRGGASKSFEMDDIMAPRIISEIKSQIIEVPVVEDVVRYVPKIQVVEVEHKVPKYEYQLVDKIVEVPYKRIVDVFEEVEEIKEVVKYVPRIKEVPVPREVIRYVPKVETKYIEKIVEVISRTQIIEIRKPYIVEQKVRRAVYLDKEVACVVAQKVVPVIRESTHENLDVEVCKYIPTVIPVDVYVPVAVQVPLIPVKKDVDETARVEVPAAHYNSLLIGLNQHFGDDVELIQALPYIKSNDGTIPLLLPNEFSGVVTLTTEVTTVSAHN